MFRENEDKILEKVWKSFLVNSQADIQEIHDELTPSLKTFRDFDRMNFRIFQWLLLIPKNAWKVAVKSFLLYILGETLQPVHKITVPQKRSLIKVFWKAL